MLFASLTQLMPANEQSCGCIGEVLIQMAAGVLAEW